MSLSKLVAGATTAVAVGASFMLYRRCLRPAGSDDNDEPYRSRFRDVLRLRILTIVYVVFSSVLKRLGLRRHAQSLRAKSRILVARALNIPPPSSKLGVCENDLTIPMDDGVVTGATLYSPHNSATAARNAESTSNGTACITELGSLPVILVRTPYNRKNLKNWGYLYAERGYHFIAQDTRGRFESSGEFFPMLSEAADGASTCAWIAKQPFCDGNIGITGVSYLGMSAWAALRNGVHPALKAVAPVLAATDLYNVIYGRKDETRGAPLVGLIYRWAYLVIHLMKTPYGALTSIFSFFLREGKTLREAYMHTPMVDVDELYLVPESRKTGGLSWFKQGLVNPRGDEPYWSDIRKCVDLDALSESHRSWKLLNEKGDTKMNPFAMPPCLIIAGWYDFFCPEQIHDFDRLRELSPESRLIVGPYTHWHVLAMAPKMHRSLLQFFDKHLRAETETANFEQRKLPRVEAFAFGECKWKTFETWPPKRTKSLVFSLTEKSLLEESDPAQFNSTDRCEPCDCATVCFDYDPSDPTPQIGGLTFNPSNCGRIDQRLLEARSDILTFTTLPLSSPLTVAGRAKAKLIVRSSASATDFVVRLCHVRAKSGRSENLSEGIRRVHNFEQERKVADDWFEIEVHLSPILNRLHVGDSLRMQVASCAFPIRGRHLNTADEPFYLARAAMACVARQELLVVSKKSSLAKSNVMRASIVTVPVLPA